MDKIFKFSCEGAAKSFVEKIGVENVEVVSATEVKAHVTHEDFHKAMDYAYCYFQEELAWAHRRISQLQEDLYKHTKEGHLPPIKGAGKLKAVLKKLGMSEDYSVEKPVIYARAGVVEVAYQKKEPINE